MSTTPQDQKAEAKLVFFASMASNWHFPFKTCATTTPTIVLQTKVEIIVTEGDLEGTKIAATVREVGASMLVVGLHDCSFLYKLTMAHSHNSIASIFNCRVLAIKQPCVSPLRPMISAVSVLDSSTNLDVSLIDLSRLQVPGTPPPKIPYRICPNPSAIIWRSRKSRRW
ncbi:uncharacterized protein LOC108330918 isoform X2 [Vigna angularis]|uniref:uncharacterized protein LOC108330918 isoform X2 n=1 Tax=Phaseolus angularis TaxID=3914 RepID=UPI0022B5919F|nr:uncharacterized protein LOC108330918 isoform X2 [Vigna angularis]